MAATIMEREADVVVVGAGIVGCATAYFLARRGARVIVVERAPLPGEQSRKNRGFVRQQGRDPVEVPLVMEANRIWRGLEQALGADIEWVQGGNLALAADEQRVARFEAWLPVAREFGLETGFSGHGFAIGPIAGRLMSELIVDGKPSLDLSAFRFSRFAEGAVGKPRNVL